MKDELIQRINELARIKKTTGLSPAEAEEQKELYQKYLQYIREQVVRQLDDAGYSPRNCQE